MDATNSSSSPNHSTPDRHKSTIPESGGGGDGFTHIRFLVSHFEAGIVIGKGGATIRKLQSNTGARIQLSRINEFFPGTEDRIIMVSGNVDDVLSATYFILSKLLRKMEKGDHEVGPMSQVRMIVPDGACGRLIGRRGANIKSMIMESQTVISLLPLDSNYSSDRLMMITGSLDGQMEAIKLVLHKLFEDGHYAHYVNVPFSYAAAYGTKDGPNTSRSQYQINMDDQNNSSMTIGISDDHTGLVLGCGERNISETSQVSDTRISDRDVDENRRLNSEKEFLSDFRQFRQLVEENAQPGTIKSMVRDLCQKHDVFYLEQTDDVKLMACYFLGVVRVFVIATGIRANVKTRIRNLVTKYRIPLCSHSVDDDDLIMKDKEIYYLPGKVVRSLFRYQVDGIKWLWSLHCKGKGGIIADDMGLGKTRQVCAFLRGLRASELAKSTLIVVTKTVHNQWVKELKDQSLVVRMTDASEFGTNIQSEMVLLYTYDHLQNFKNSPYYGIKWDFVFLDEGHLVKNLCTQRAKILMELQSRVRIIISGTPIQNNLEELWALFQFCYPDLLGAKKRFKQHYEAPILQGYWESATVQHKRACYKAAKELRTNIKPYFMRRLKSEVLQGGSADGVAPSKNELVVWLKLTDLQRQFYKCFLKGHISLSAFYSPSLAALTVLQQICDHPSLVAPSTVENVCSQILGANDVKDHIPCKILFLIELLDKLIHDEHNVLIFARSPKMLKIIQQLLETKERGYTFLRIDGTTKYNDRETIVKKFQAGSGSQILLLTSQVGSLGLTLTNADRVIIVDPAWNPSIDNQSVDRTCRIGQKKEVIAYRLVSSGTIEETKYRKQVYKAGLLKLATEHDEPTSYFSKQDLNEAFDLHKDGFDVSLTRQQLSNKHGQQHHNMNESLKEHVQFLEGLQMVAGISYHSLLFSKTVPLQVPQEGDKLERLKAKRVTKAAKRTAKGPNKRKRPGGFFLGRHVLIGWYKNRIGCSTRSRKPKSRKDSQKQLRKKSKRNT